MSYIRTCRSCSMMFETDNYQKQYCGRDCQSHAIRRTKRSKHEVEFIGIDGEGMDINGKHEYVLLSCGDQSLEKDGAPLHYLDIFQFLYDQYLENPTATFVGFYLGYDFTQWLKGLPQNRAEMLLTKEGVAKRQPKSIHLHQPFPVRIGEAWEIDLLAGKRFKLRPIVAREEKAASWMYICDAGSFFQTSFMKVIDPRGWPKEDYPITQEDYEIILEGKEKRSTARFDRDMVRYNVTENRALSLVMNHLNEGFVKAGVRLKKQQWFGPGQAAQAWLHNNCDHPSSAVNKVIPQEVIEAAIASYYGGWFEIYLHGHVTGVMYEYDINSAYPYSITQLPCLLHGKWVNRVSRKSQWSIELCRIVACTDVMGAMPCRSAQGAIFRPLDTIGWYWTHEIDAMVAAGIARRIKTGMVWSYEPCPCRPPMRSVRGLYDERIRLGPQGKNSPQGKALKLLYNSLYGKFAQSQGMPPFANAVWASLIPSLTRTQIVQAIGSHPRGIESLAMVATDGVYFREPHPGLEISPTTLGGWDVDQKENMCLLMPGMYWDDRARENIKGDKVPAMKTRGIAAGAIFDRLWNVDVMFWEFMKDPSIGWPKWEIPVAFNMVTATQALARNDWGSAGRVTTNEVRVISSNPQAKRDPSPWYDGDVMRTRIHMGAYQSVPYDKRFGMERKEGSLLEDITTPDGDMYSLLAEIITKG